MELHAFHLKVTIKLDFVAPLEGHDVAVFTLDPEGDTTDVTWSMDGPTPFGKVIGMFLNMDSMIGSDRPAWQPEVHRENNASIGPR